MPRRKHETTTYVDCPECGLPAARIDTDSCDGAYEELPFDTGYRLRVYVDVEQPHGGYKPMILDVGIAFPCSGSAAEWARVNYPGVDYDIGREKS